MCLSGNRVGSLDTDTLEGGMWRTEHFWGGHYSQSNNVGKVNWHTTDHTEDVGACPLSLCYCPLYLCYCPHYA